MEIHGFSPTFWGLKPAPAPVFARAPQAPRRLRSPEERRGRGRGAGDDGGHRAVLRRRDRRSGQAPPGHRQGTLEWPGLNIDMVIVG